MKKDCFFDEMNESLYEEIISHVNSNDQKWLNDWATKCNSSSEDKKFVIIDKSVLNAQRYVNRHFIEINGQLEQEGLYICYFDSSAYRRTQLYKRHSKFVADVIFPFDFFWHRACPKMALTKKIYFWVNKRVKRVFPRPEIIGRLCFCGFEIVGEGESDGRNYVVAKKVKEPSTDAHPSYSLIIRLPRVGKDNKIINVYKIRTMYAYSEYMQDYIYKKHNLKKGGKIADDYRISAWGSMMRKCWLDELPMIFNVFKGELKLMGVRPLSHQYFELYTPEMQALHVSVKPGLIPPYYADLPETLEEIQDSERRYIEQYKAHPFRTNWKYFWRIFKNIFVKHKHSC